ncbi:LysM domain-containing protein [Stomatohabitans albus]|uniref:LysM peptidoglycan-binding domain-containing protein n=1 Tax=Stomatohabitans albus TaxID=3110766 RepID=UPI00300C9940
MSENKQAKPTIAWARVIFVGFIIVVAFSIGRFSTTFGPDLQQTINDLTEENALLKASTIRKDGEIEQCRKLVYSLDGSLAGVENPGETNNTTNADGESVRTYLVKENDTLSSIANTVYANSQLFGAIRDANNISAANPLRVGSEIIIPPLEEAVSKANDEERKSEDDSSEPSKE